MSVQVQKIIISETSERVPYETAARAIDDYLLTEAGNREITVLCSADNNKMTLGEIYAEDRGYRVEYSCGFINRFLVMTDYARKRRMVKDCDSLLLFFDGENYGVKDWIKLAVSCKKPFYMKHFE